MFGNNSNQATLLAARYRANAPPQTEIWNDVLTTLLSHRSVRAYLDKPVPDEWLTQIIAAAQSAATSSNLQAWSVIAVRDEARKARMAELADNQAYIAKAPIFLVWCADLSRVKRIAQGKRQELAGADYLEAFLLAVVDASLAAQNAVVAAESLGLGICYIGALRDHPEKVAEELNLPPGAFALFGLCLGFPDPARPASIRPRLPQSAVLHFEQYDTRKEPEIIEAYNAAQREFQREQKMRLVDWADRMMERLAGAEALHGRDRIKQALKKLGFPLN